MDFGVVFFCGSIDFEEGSVEVVAFPSHLGELRFVVFLDPRVLKDLFYAHSLSRILLKQV